MFPFGKLSNWCFFTRSWCSVFTIGLGFSLNFIDKFLLTVFHLIKIALEFGTQMYPNTSSTQIVLKKLKTINIYAKILMALSEEKIIIKISWDSLFKWHVDYSRSTPELWFVSNCR
jgi:hypothetical protein